MDKHYPGFLKRGGGAGHAPSMTSTVLFFGVFFIFVGALVYTGCIDAVHPPWTGDSPLHKLTPLPHEHHHRGFFLLLHLLIIIPLG